MSLIRLHDVSMRYEDRSILREVYFRLREGKRVGLIGKNGTGKTTVLRLILGEVEPTAGRVERAPGLRIGYFSQFSALDSSRSIQQVLEDLFADVRALEAELEGIPALLERATSPKEQVRVLEQQAAIIEELDRREGWEHPRHIDTALTRLGFDSLRRTQPIAELSGGWRNRAALAQCLLEPPDVLLLDEPTNYLDVAGVEWLETWLHRFHGAAIIVSHDRHFLDRVVDRILEVENYHLHEYDGNYTAYVREKPLRMKQLERQFRHEEELLVLEAEAIRDREVAQRDASGGVQRKLASIKKRQEPRPIDTIVTGLYIGLYVPEKLCRAEAVSKGYGGEQLFRDLSFEIHRGDRVAVIGSNGSGKSTLLRVLTGKEQPDAGRVVWERGVTFADFNEVMRELDDDDSVTHAVNVTKLAFLAPRKQVNRFLALLRFAEGDLTRRIGELSGGQRARVALASCLLSGAAVLILDEPTNHLDVASIQVMERALAHFPGAVVVVSHDRFFIDKVATQLLVFKGDGRVGAITGNWTTWQAVGDRSAAGA